MKKLMNDIYAAFKHYPRMSIFVAVVALGIVGSLFTKTNNEPAPEPQVQASAAVPANYKAQGLAMVLAKSEAKKHYGKADYDVEQATDMGDNNWIVSGYADIPGRRVYWTCQLQINPNDSYTLQGWAER